MKGNDCDITGNDVGFLCSIIQGHEHGNDIPVFYTNDMIMSYGLLLCHSELRFFVPFVTLRSVKVFFGMSHRECLSF